MSNFFKSNVFSVLAVGSFLGGAGLMSGCGGGSDNGSAIGSGTGTSSAGTTFDGTYQARLTPSDAVPADGQVPNATLSVAGGRATSQFTFFLQPSVVSQVQAAINTGLTDAGFAGAISNNIVPASISFNATSRVDGSGRVVFTSEQDVNVCGRATLTLDTSLPNTAGASGQGTYNIAFPNTLIIRAGGQNNRVEGTCNNLPLRAGTVVVTR